MEGDTSLITMPDGRATIHQGDALANAKLKRDWRILQLAEKDAEVDEALHRLDQTKQMAITTRAKRVEVEEELNSIRTYALISKSSTITHRDVEMLNASFRREIEEVLHDVRAWDDAPPPHADADWNALPFEDAVMEAARMDNAQLTSPIITVEYYRPEIVQKLSIGGIQEQGTSSIGDRYTRSLANSSYVPPPDASMRFRVHETYNFADLRQDVARIMRLSTEVVDQMELWNPRTNETPSEASFVQRYVRQGFLLLLHACRHVSPRALLGDHHRGMGRLDGADEATKGETEGACRL